MMDVLFISFPGSAGSAWEFFSRLLCLRAISYNFPDLFFYVFHSRQSLVTAIPRQSLGTRENRFLLFPIPYSLIPLFPIPKSADTKFPDTKFPVPFFLCFSLEAEPRDCHSQAEPGNEVIINYQLSIINYQLSIINYQLSIIN